MDKHRTDLLDDLRQADPATTFRADALWISHRLGDLLADDPAFQAPQILDAAPSRATSRRPRLVWMSSAAAVLLVSGGFFAGNFFANSDGGDSSAVAPLISESDEMLGSVPDEESSYPGSGMDSNESAEITFGTESADTLNHLASAPAEEKFAWLTERLDPDLTGTIEVDLVTGNVSFQTQLAQTQSDISIRNSAETAYEASNLLIAELVAVFAPHEQYRVTHADLADTARVRATVEFIDEATGQINRTWVLEHDNYRPISFTGVLVN